eukprot:g7523.t1
MSTYSAVDCTFDGNCELCEDADITLKFDDHSELKAHSLVLRKSSSVLKCAIAECSNDKIIHLRSTSRDVWIEILRELYPQTHTFIPNRIMQLSFEDIIEGFSREAHKYDIQCILHTIDHFITWKINSKDEKNNLEHTCMKLLPYFKIAGQCDLKQSKQATTKLLIEAMQKRDEDTYRRNCSTSYASKYKYLEESIQLVLDTGDSQWSVSILGGILCDVLKLHVTVPTHSTNSS